MTNDSPQHTLAAHRYGPLEILTDYCPVNGEHPVGNRCLAHDRCVANLRLASGDIGPTGDSTASTQTSERAEN